MTSSYHLEDRNKNIPKLRFKEYNDEWVEYQLGKICKTYSGGTPNVSNLNFYNGLIPFIKSGEIHSNQTAMYITEEGLKNSSAKLVNKGDLLFALYGATSGEVDISKIDGAINQAILCVKSNYINLIFLKEILSFNKNKILCKYLQGGQGNLSADIFKTLKFKFPTLREQEKIASFLTLIDKKIEKQKELVELLKKYKRGLLSQIFSQNLRFKDNNGNDYPAWEECRFDEIFQILGNNTLSRECLNYTNVGVKNIHYGDVLVKYNTCINDKIDQIPNINSDINLDKISSNNYLKVGDIIMADTAEDYTVGKTCEIVSCKTKILSGLHTIPCRPKQNFAKGYLVYYLNSAEYHDKLIPLITGIKVSSISKKQIKKTIIKYPIYGEQEKIANLLLLIENKLNSNIKKLKLFETYKKGLLQQLFI